MTGSAGWGRRARGAVAVAVLLLAGCASARAGTDGGPGSGGVTTAAASDPAADWRSTRSHPAVAAPVRLRIPSIGVDTGLERLGLDASGAVAPPQGWQKAGWYAAGVRPGQSGPAVLLGHVDSRSGPAVFYRLATLRPGAAVYVRRADGSTASFRVTGRQQVAKTRFPSDLVYGASLAPSLRLVTCGGSYDAHAGHYRDNVIVTAVPS